LSFLMIYFAIFVVRVAASFQSFVGKKFRRFFKRFF